MFCVCDNERRRPPSDWVSVVSCENGIRVNICDFVNLICVFCDHHICTKYKFQPKKIKN